MFPIRFDDVFTPFRATDNKAAVIRLDKYIASPSSLNIVYYLAGRAPLPGA